MRPTARSESPLLAPMRARLRGLFAITPDTADTTQLVAQVEAALQGGAALVQYRNKTAAATLKREQAHALAILCLCHNTPLIINDDLSLALEVDAAGVHLGREDGDIAAARARLGPEKILGASCYNTLDRAIHAAAAGVDYIAFGAVFVSATKPQAAHAPLSLITTARDLGYPIAAIGGITLDNAGSVIAAGAAMLAVITDLFDAPDIRARATAYRQLFESVTP